MSELENIDFNLNSAENETNLPRAVEAYLDGILDLIDLFDEHPSPPIDNRISLHVSRLKDRCLAALKTSNYLTKYETIALWNAYIFFNENDLIDDETAIKYMRKLNNSCDEEKLDSAVYQKISDEELYIMPLFGNKSFKEQGLSKDEVFKSNNTPQQHQAHKKHIEIKQKLSDGGLGKTKKTLKLSGKLSLKSITSKSSD